MRDRGCNNQEQKDYFVKMELPTFNGSVSIEEYLDWVNEVEMIFYYTSRELVRCA